MKLDASKILTIEIDNQVDYLSNPTTEYQHTERYISMNITSNTMPAKTIIIQVYEGDIKDNSGASYHERVHAFVRDNVEPPARPYIDDDFMYSDMENKNLYRDLMLQLSTLNRAIGKQKTLHADIKANEFMACLKYVNQTLLPHLEKLAKDNGNIKYFLETLKDSGLCQDILATVKQRIDKTSQEETLAHDANEKTDATPSKYPWFY